MEDFLNELRQAMQKVLKPSRYEHTNGVAYTAANLAMRYEVSIDDALIAGILHDNAKYVDTEELIRLCEENDIEITVTESKNPYLLHSKAGAVIAKERYHVTKQEILDAIMYHTTGRPGMTTLEKIIFVADYIEPNRKSIPNLDRIRKEAFLNLDKTVALILYNTLQYLMATKEKADIDEMTIKSYEYYKTKGVD